MRSSLAGQEQRDARFTSTAIGYGRRPSGDLDFYGRQVEACRQRLFHQRHRNDADARGRHHVHAGAIGLPVALISQVTYGCASPRSPQRHRKISREPVLRTSLRRHSVRHTSATPTLVELNAPSSSGENQRDRAAIAHHQRRTPGKIASRNSTRAVIITGLRLKRSDSAPPSANAAPVKPLATEAPNESQRHDGSRAVTLHGAAFGKRMRMISPNGSTMAPMPNAIRTLAPA